MRLLFVARAIDRMAGGVERIITVLMNELSARGNQVSLLTWDLADAESFYPMEPAIDWHRLGLGSPNVRASAVLLMHRGRAVRGLISRQKPQAIVCFQDGPFMAIRGYTLGWRIPIIAAERNAPDRFHYISAGRYRGIIFQSLRLATRITIQCESYRDLYPHFLQKRLVCIPNPVPPARVQAHPDVANIQGRYRLLSVGRLGFQKNYRVLLEAFARLASRYANWDLMILGEGEDRIPLECLRRTHGLQDRVLLPGVTKSVEECYVSSHLFCLPSRWEGFPNALAEALAHGLPAVGFSGCAGVRDLITSGHSGLLAPGNGAIDSLTDALGELMSNAELRRSMGAAAIQSMQRFHPNKVFSRWQELLSEVALK
jgi:glycosyltransferase involved in cell wall biosynthesis